jgi:hypothetical protein
MALDEEPAGAQHRPAIADRIPIFALLGANVVSSVGNNITLLAVPWFVLETTGSAVRRGIAGAAMGIGGVRTTVGEAQGVFPPRNLPSASVVRTPGLVTFDPRPGCRWPVPRPGTQEHG